MHSVKPPVLDPDVDQREALNLIRAVRGVLFNVRSMWTCAFVLATACAPMPMSDLRNVITARDMIVNRPNTDNQEARFRMQPDGSGTVEFLNGSAGPQDVSWSLTGNTFCIDADEGLMRSFDCATLVIVGDQVTLAHTDSDNVALGRLQAR